LLSDKEVLEAIKWNKIVIEPFNRERLGPCSYDITTRIVKEDEESLYLVSEETITIGKDIVGIGILRSNASKRVSPVIASYSQLIDPGYSGKLIFRILKLKFPIGDIANLFQIVFFRLRNKVEVGYNERSKSTAMGRQGF